MTKYKNIWHRPFDQHSLEYFTTDVDPIEHKGFLFYYRIQSNNPSARCYDIVKNGVCIGQYAGIGKTEIEKDHQIASALDRNA